MRQDQKDIQEIVRRKLQETPGFFGKIILRFESGVCRLITVEENIKLDRPETPAAVSEN